MSYASFYLNSSLPSNMGLGTEFRLLKIPHASGGPAGATLIGSLVQRNNDCPLGIFERSYPVPFQLADPGLFLTKMAEVGINNPVNIDTMAGCSLVMGKSSGLELSASGTFPGLPFSLNLAVDLSSILSVTLSLAEKWEMRSIPLSKLGVLVDKFGGDAQKAFPGAGVSIPDNYIVDAVAVARNYAWEFTQADPLSASFGVLSAAAGDNLGGKVKVTQTNTTQFRVALADNVDYLIGLQVIRWDNL